MKNLWLLIMILAGVEAHAAESLKINWKKEFRAENESCVPHIIAADNQGNIFVIASNFEFLNKEKPTDLRLWQIDSSGKKVRDVSLEQQPYSLGLLMDWTAREMVFSKNQLLFPGGKKEKKLFNVNEGRFGAPMNKPIDIDIESSAGLRQTQNKNYLAAGRYEDKKDPNDHGPAAILLDKDFKPLWKKQYDIMRNARITDVATDNEFFFMCGYGFDEPKSLAKTWLARCDMNGDMVKKIDFDCGSRSSRPPAISLIDTTENIVVAYNKSRSMDDSDIYFSIYSFDLNLITEKSIFTSDKYFSNFAIRPIHDGFVVAVCVETTSSYIILNQYNAKGELVGTVNIEGMGMYGSRDPKLTIFGKTAYLAANNSDKTYLWMYNKESRKEPGQVPFVTVITSIELK